MLQKITNRISLSNKHVRSKSIRSRAPKIHPNRNQTLIDHKFTALTRTHKVVQGTMVPRPIPEGSNKAAGVLATRRVYQTAACAWAGANRLSTRPA